MSPSDEVQSNAMNCTQCGVGLMEANTLDYFELRLHYVSDAKKELVERALDRLVGVDLSQSRRDGPHSDILIGVFCGAKCLSSYVQAHIEPDAATET